MIKSLILEKEKLEFEFGDQWYDFVEPSPEKDDLCKKLKDSSDFENPDVIAWHRDYGCYIIEIKDFRELPTKDKIEEKVKKMCAQVRNGLLWLAVTHRAGGRRHVLGEDFKGKVNFIFLVEYPDNNDAILQNPFEVKLKKKMVWDSNSAVEVFSLQQNPLPDCRVTRKST